MLHELSVRLCRFYQSLFPNGNPEEDRLVKLHQSGMMEQFYQEYFRHELEKGTKSLERFVQHSKDWNGCIVLDFGCGGGGLTFQLAKRFQEAWGIDLEPDKLAFAEHEADRLGYRNVHFRCYDGKCLPFDDSSFDCVYCVDVIEHLPTPAFFVKEFFRVLRPGGELLLSFGPPWRHPHGKHMWSMLPGWWTHLLFPRTVVMEVRGYDPKTTWEDIGLHRLTVSAFESIMNRSGFEKTYADYGIKRIVRPLKAIPFVREFFIGEVIAVFKRPLRCSTRLGPSRNNVQNSEGESH
jgi:ubiquinone/menaquinone biosynthesis C-methylase UbiE